MSQKALTHETMSRWFFIVIAVIMIVLAWRIVEPFALVLATAGIAAIIASPLHRRITKALKSERVSAMLVIIGVLIAIVVPTILIGTIIVQQAADIIKWSLSEESIFNNVDFSQYTLVQSLPMQVQEELANVDVAHIGSALGTWITQRLGDIFSAGAQFIFQTLIFFIAFYYVLVDRDRIHKMALDLSPFKDKLDTNIVQRIVKTVRSLVAGALIIAILQGVVAGIGFAIAGVPGAVFWGAIVVIAAQIPMIGASIIMVPAVGYLIATGNYGAALFLTIWAILAVGMIGNILTPKLLGGRTQMPEILVLIFILGGLQFFGAIGFILGPTILAGLIVMIELYKAGFLEKGK